MRPYIVLVAILFSISSIHSASAGVAVEVDDVGASFGGITLNTNASGNVSSNLTDLPSIVEYYTATWCTNCVYVEHALDDIENNGTNIQQFHFHRDQDSEDPWGTTAGEARWNDRYDGGQPPTVVFNGSMKQVGSVPESDSLENDYIKLAGQSLDLGLGSSSMTWVSTTNSTGVLSWSISHSEDLVPEGGDLISMVWITERYAYFPDGSNGVENYPHVVKGIIELGNASVGTMNLTLPDAHDGNDLQIHLIHQIVLPEIVDDCEVTNDCVPEPKAVEDENGLPSIGIIAVLSVTIIAAITTQRRLE